jgi:hypothetical protein
MQTASEKPVNFVRVYQGITLRIRFIFQEAHKFNIKIRQSPIAAWNFKTYAEDSA